MSLSISTKDLVRLIDERLAAARRVQCIDSREAAKLLGISERKLAQLVAEGEVPSFLIGRSRRFEVLDLEDWIASRTEGGASCK